MKCGRHLELKKRGIRYRGVYSKDEGIILYREVPTARNKAKILTHMKGGMQDTWAQQLMEAGLEAYSK